MQRPAGAVPQPLDTPTHPLHARRRQVPLVLVFTKCDARKKGAPGAAANVKAWKAAWLQDYEALPACFESSAATGAGRAEILNHLASLRVLEETQGGAL
jgi:GTP-binding protein